MRSAWRVITIIWLLSKCFTFFISYSGDLNIAFRAFGIETLGSEILHSLYILYGRDRYRREAAALGLGQNWMWNKVIRREDFLRNRECVPKVS